MDVSIEKIAGAVPAVLPGPVAPVPGDRLDIVGLTAGQAMEARYSWLRDGAPIERADGPVYHVVAADQGTDLTAMVTLADRTVLTSAALAVA